MLAPGLATRWCLPAALPLCTLEQRAPPGHPHSRSPGKTGTFLEAAARLPRRHGAVRGAGCAQAQARSRQPGLFSLPGAAQRSELSLWQISMIFKV